MAAPPETRFYHSRIVAKQGIQFEDDDKIVWGTDNDGSSYFDGTAVQHKDVDHVFQVDVQLNDDKHLVLGSDNDASVYFDGTRVTHANAEEIFRKNVTIPIYASTDYTSATLRKRSAILIPDRASKVTAVRVGWTQVPHTSTYIPLWIGKRAAATPTTTEWLLAAPGTVDMEGIATAYFGKEYTMTSSSTIPVLAAGDYVFASLTLPSILNTAGLGGAVTLEYEVYG